MQNLRRVEEDAYRRIKSLLEPK